MTIAVTGRLFRSARNVIHDLLSGGADQQVKPDREPQAWMN
jgi:hypothetical protein